MKYTKPFALAIALCISSYGLADTQQSDSTPTQPSNTASQQNDSLSGQIGGISDSFTELDKEIAALSASVGSMGDKIFAAIVAAVHNYNNLIFQNDSFFTSSNTTALDNAKTTLPESTKEATQKTIDWSLHQINLQAIPAPVGGAIGNAIEKAEALGDQSHIQNLYANGIKANDTLYAPKLTKELGKTMDKQAASVPSKEEVTNGNSYFNVASLIAPNVYMTTEQDDAAKSFITYLGATFQSPTPQIDYSKLKQTLSGQDAKKQANTILKIINNKKYQNYMLQVRSNTAAKSVALSNLNWLYQMRTKIKQKIGDKVIELPSSIQEMSDQVFTNKINNPEWYAAMKTAAPATLQREQLLLTADLINEEHQKTMYEQRLLVTESAMLLQLINQGQYNLLTQAQDINSILGAGASGIKSQKDINSDLKANQQSQEASKSLGSDGSN